MKALVTGGAGFIGSHVARHLLDEGHEVRVLHLPGENLLNLDGLDVELMPGDVTDRALVRRAVSGRDWVFHLAAIYALWLPRTEKMREVNVGGTRNVLTASAEAGVERVVHTSSIAVFAGQGLDRDATEESSFRLRTTGDVYSRTKYESHQLAKEFAKQGLDVTIVAPCGPIGPGDVGPTPTGRFLVAAVNAPIPLAIETVFNFGDVRDMAAGHVLAAKKGKTGESYLLGNQNVWMSELPGIVNGLFRLRRPKVKIPPRLLVGGAHAMLAYSRFVSKREPFVTPAALAISRMGLRASCEKAFRELGLPRRPVEDSIRDAIVWFARNGYIWSPRLRKRILKLS